MRITHTLAIAALGTCCLQAEAGAQTIPDLNGADWEWQSTERLRLPRAFVEAMSPVLGIYPEGENTHALCESVGTMILLQSGSEIEGTAIRTYNLCETSGGQEFQQPSPALDIADGHVTPHTVYFSFESFTVTPCPHEIVITDVVDGRAIHLAGTGWCILPGHPQSDSPVPLPPPPGGTSKTLSWEARRP